MARRVKTLYARLHTGHANELADFRVHILKQDEDINCKECQVPEDIEHALCYCAVTEEARTCNWDGKVKMEMLRDEPEVCRKILFARFPGLSLKKEQH